MGCWETLTPWENPKDRHGVASGHRPRAVTPTGSHEGCLCPGRQNCAQHLAGIHPALRHSQRIRRVTRRCSELPPKAVQAVSPLVGFVGQTVMSAHMPRESEAAGSENSGAWGSPILQTSQSAGSAWNGQSRAKLSPAKECEAATRCQDRSEPLRLKHLCLERTSPRSGPGGGSRVQEELCLLRVPMPWRIARCLSSCQSRAAEAPAPKDHKF